MAIKPNKKQLQHVILSELQARLYEELSQYEAEVSAHREDVTDGHERYLRVLNFLIRSLVSLRRLDNKADVMDTEEEHRNRVQQLEEIQRRLARIAAAENAGGLSPKSD